jgi:hypothetical protein
MTMLDDCSNYLDGTIYNLQQKIVNFEEQDEDIRDQLCNYDIDNEYNPKKTNNYVYG